MTFTVIFHRFLVAAFIVGLAVCGIAVCGDKAGVATRTEQPVRQR